MLINKGFDGLTGRSSFCCFLIFRSQFTHTNGKSLLRIFGRKDGVGVGVDLTPLWRFCTHYWYLLGMKCTIFVGFRFSVVTLLGDLVYCCTLCDHCCCLWFIWFGQCRLSSHGFTDITDRLIGSGW